MKIARRFTAETGSAYDGVAFRRTASEIRNPDGSVVFSLKDIEVPAAWSQVASELRPSKRSNALKAATKASWTQSRAASSPWRLTMRAAVSARSRSAVSAATACCQLTRHPSSVMRPVPIALKATLTGG